MAYYNPVTTIASVGTQTLPVPVTISSTTEPATRPNGGALKQGDDWFNPDDGRNYLYISGKWELVGTSEQDIYKLPIASPSVLGGIMQGANIDIDPNDGRASIPLATLTEKGVVNVGDNISVFDGEISVPNASVQETGVMQVGTNLVVDGTGVVSLSPTPTVTTLNTNSTLTAHTIVTGAEAGVAINASAGEITAKWLNIGKNLEVDPNDVNYGVSIRSTGTTISPNTDVTVLSGPRQGMVYKLSVGDGLTFRDHASSHIGGTVGATAQSGNQYSVNSGTIDLVDVMRTVGDQTLTGDLTVEAGALGRTGTITAVSFSGDGSNLTGVIPSPATTSTLGTVIVGSNLSVTADGTLSADAQAPVPATTTSLGEIIVGDNLSVTTDGTLSGSPPYTLPEATATDLGGVKIGTGINVTNGTISMAQVFQFQDTIDATTEQPPASPQIGWVLLNTVSGTVTTGWGNLSNKAIQASQLIIYSAGGWVEGAVQDQTSYLPLAGGNVTGDLSVGGTFGVTGTSTFADDLDVGTYDAGGTGPGGEHYFGVQITKEGEVRAQANGGESSDQLLYSGRWGSGTTFSVNALGAITAGGYEQLAQRDNIRFKDNGRFEMYGKLTTSDFINLSVTGDGVDADSGYFIKGNTGATTYSTGTEVFSVATDGNVNCTDIHLKPGTDSYSGQIVFNNTDATSDTVNYIRSNSYYLEMVGSLGIKARANSFRISPDLDSTSNTISIDSHGSYGAAIYSNDSEFKVYGSMFEGGGLGFFSVGSTGQYLAMVADSITNGYGMKLRAYDTVGSQYVDSISIAGITGDVTFGGWIQGTPGQNFK